MPWSVKPATCGQCATAVSPDVESGTPSDSFGLSAPAQGYSVDNDHSHTCRSERVSTSRGEELADLRRLRVAISGAGAVGGGVTTFYSFVTAPSGYPAAIKTFLNAAPLLFPTAVTFNVPNSGDTLDDVTGALTGTWTDGSVQTPFSGTNNSEWASGVGMQVRWQTGKIHNRRRLVGSTFFVPIAASIFDTDGTIDAATVTSMNAAIATLLASGQNLAIWSRPKPARPGAHGELPAVAGKAELITSGALQDRTSWLRSRRT